MKIAICDDDKKICTQIENTLLEYVEKSMQNVEVLVFFCGEDLIEYMNKGNLFQLIYLDIEMKKINGVDVGKYIRKILKDYATEIVYISGHNGYDRQLFDVQPLHFIEKPILSNIVIQDFELALERIGKKTLYFHYQKEHDTYRVSVNDIIYLENSNREIKIIMTSGNDSFYGTFDEITLRLSGQFFIQIHRSFLVNYNHVSIIRYSDVVMSNGVTLPISRAKRQEFRRMQLLDF